MAPRILKKRFLDRILKRITNASREFQIENGFELVEKAPYSDINEVNPYTGEGMGFMDPSPVSGSISTSATPFSAELTIVDQIDIFQKLAGTYPVGTKLVVINSAEMDAKEFTIPRLEAAEGINIKQPVDINSFGSFTTTRNGFYNIKSVTPSYIKDRLIEVTLEVELSDPDDSD